MTDKPDGGLAFPHHEVWDDDKTDIGWIGGGMTLRDWFAGQAMAAIISKRKSFTTDDYGVFEREASQNASGAYHYADAMIAERENQ